MFPSLKLKGVVGYKGRQNDVIYCHPWEKTEQTKAVIYFGGDMQDFYENMEKFGEPVEKLRRKPSPAADDETRYCKRWDLDFVANVLTTRFPTSHIIVIRPSRIELRTYSCYDNFVRCNNHGVPEHIPTRYALNHLEQLLKCISDRVRTEKQRPVDESGLEDGEIMGSPEQTEWWSQDLNLDMFSLRLIGFSKGCVVLNQFIYEFHYLKTLTPDDKILSRFVDRITDIYWLDGGHSGDKNTWITSRCLLETLSRLVSPEEMTPSGRVLTPGEDDGYAIHAEDYFPREDADEVLAWVRTIVHDAIERAIPDPKVVLTLDEAGRCLSVLGKIWNLTECPEGCEIDSVRCETSDEKLLDMEGYVDEYQYLHLGAVDKGLTDIRVIPQHFAWLLSVDLSGNCLTNVSACPLTKLPNLVSVKLDRNRIVDPYLEPMRHLQHLGLASNGIESLHRIYHPSLASLDVSWNAIAAIDGRDCWKLKGLKELDLRGNRLGTTAGIEYQNLVALYLAENRITRLRGLGRLPNLERLHLRGNPLASLSGLTAANRKLRYLNVRSCKISDVLELEKLRALESLRVLVVTDNLFNPSPGDGEQRVRLEILQILPRLQRINKNFVTREDWKKARDALEERLEFA